MSSLRKSLLIALGVLVSACGFQPMHGARYDQPLSAGISIDAPKDAMGQQFKQDLEDQLNPGGVPARPKYKLSVSLSSAAAAIGVARDGTVLRFNVILTSGYILTRLSDNKEIKRGEVKHVSSYNNQVNQYFSTYISEKDAISRGITELSELYRQRLGVILLKGEGA